MALLRRSVWVTVLALQKSQPSGLGLFRWWNRHRRLALKREGLIDRQIQFKHVDPRFAQETKLAAQRMGRNQFGDMGRRNVPRFRHSRRLGNGIRRTNLRIESTAGLCDSVRWNRACVVGVVFAKGCCVLLQAVGEGWVSGAEIGRAGGCWVVALITGCGGSRVEVLRLGKDSGH